MKIDKTELKHSRTIEYFEGDILTEYLTEDGRVILFKWCDQDKDGQIYLVTESTIVDVQCYLEGTLSMSDLLKCDEDSMDCYIVKVKNNTVVEEKAVVMKDVPKLYKPSKDAFYDESLSIN